MSSHIFNKILSASFWLFLKHCLCYLYIATRFTQSISFMSGTMTKVPYINFNAVSSPYHLISFSHIGFCCTQPPLFVCDIGGSVSEGHIKHCKERAAPVSSCFIQLRLRTLLHNTYHIKLVLLGTCSRLP